MGQRKRETALLLVGFLLLAACTAPAARPSALKPTPTPEVTVTPSPEPTPAPTLEPTSTPEEIKELWGFPIDDTHDAFEVPTGGKLGTVLVTVEMIEGDYEFMNPAKLSVWDSADLSEPIQVMDADGFTHFYELLDANFDGYMDFSYTWLLAATNKNDSLWLWDEETGKFVYGEDFAGHGIVLDEEAELIYAYMHGSASSGTTCIFHWENGELVCIRRIETHYPEFEMEPVTQLLTVEDYINGEWIEVYRKVFGDPNNGEIYDEAARWGDLSYHGEEVETLWGFPLDDTHDAFEVPTGGKLGTVLVTLEMERSDTQPIGSVTLSVWDSSDMSEPIQTIVEEDCWVICEYASKWNEVVDANFDGYMDFGIEEVRGATATSYWFYWLWNEEEGRFAEEPALVGQRIYFDKEREIVCSEWNGWSYPVQGGTSYMRWEDGELVTIRYISRDGYYGDEETGLQGMLTVEDNIDGVLTEVFKLTADPNTILEEAEKWKDLDYHGEP